MGYQPASQGAQTEVPQLIGGISDLLHYFQGKFKKPDEVAIGMEVEKQGVLTDSLKPVGYFGKSGVRRIQEKLVDELGWQVERKEGKYITCLSRGQSRYYLEFGASMTELSGRTHPSIHDLARELRIHQNEVSEISRLFNISWLGIGYFPFSHEQAIKLIRINRFETLYDYFRKQSKPLAENWKKDLFCAGEYRLHLGERHAAQVSASFTIVSISLRYVR